MIQLINNSNQIAVLSPDTSIEIQRNNPIFNEDELLADITFSFRMPLCPQNKDFIKNGHLIESRIDVYEQEVKLLAEGTPLHAGILSYKIISGEIDALFKINFGAIAERVKTITMAEIYTGDAMYNPYTAEQMKQAATNPKSYPYSFFPVYNASWNEGNESPDSVFVNNWDNATQSFKTDVAKATCPYFKLKHILTKLMQVLGFDVEGDYISNPDTDEVYIYSRIISTPYLNGSFTYLPNDLVISDFLKLVKERFNISCNFDIVTGKVNIQDPISALENSPIQDLSPYVVSIDEIYIPEKKGYSITLTPDGEDRMFLDTSPQAKEGTYIPTNRLVIGSREKDVEIGSSTLKSKEFTGYTVPAADQPLFFSGSPAKPFPIRFLRYPGLTNLGNGKVFPQAFPLELGADDATWYQFLNEGKIIKLQIKIPAAELARFKVYQRISFLSEQGNYTIALPEQVTYALTAVDSSYVNVTIQCRQIVTEFQDLAQVIDYKPISVDEDSSVPDNYLPPTYKAYFNAPLQYIDFQIVSARDAGSRKSIQRLRIPKSTNKFATGGDVITPLFAGTGSIYELRIMNGIPKYMIQCGIKMYFTQREDYYYIDLNNLPRYAYDGQGSWIVFTDLD